MKKQSINQSKIEFLSGVKKPEYSYAKYFEMLFPYLCKGYRSYELLTKFGINKSSVDLQEKDFLDFYKVIYDFWYDSISELSFFDAGKHRKTIRAILKNPNFSKENMTNKDCEKFFFDTLPNQFRDLGISPIISQHRINPCQNGEIQKDFLHVVPFRSQKFSAPLDVRFYMNIPPINAITISMLLTNACYNQSLPLYFKFWTKANQRNDQFLVYTTYTDAPKIISILDKIREEYPFLFIGASINNGLYGKINDYVYFGETPNTEIKSFNDIRAKAFDNYFSVFLSDTLTPLIQKDEPIVLEDGTKVSPKNFLIELMKKEYLKALEINQDKIKKGQFPNATMTDAVMFSPSAINIYKEEQNRLYNNAIKGEFDSKTLIDFEDAANFLIAQIKRNSFPKLLLHITHYTKELGISGKPEDEEIEELTNQGHITYYERFRVYDYINTLLSAYHISENCHAYIDNAKFNSILKKYGLDPENSSLNQTTAQNLNLVKERE